MEHLQTVCQHHYLLWDLKAENYWRENSDKFDVIFLTDDNKQYVTEGIYKDYSSDNKVIKITKDK